MTKKDRQKLIQQIQRKRAGLELFEAINRELAKIQAKCEKADFLQSAIEIRKHAKEIGRYMDLLFKYMMNRVRRGD